MNNVSLIGNLTKEIEERKTNSGLTTCRFTLAVKRNYKNKQTNEYESDFIMCSAIGAAADILVKYVKKGHKVGLQGHIKTGSYDKQDGTRQYTWEVNVNQVDLLNNSTNNSINNQNQQNNYFDNKAQEKFNNNGGGFDDIEDSLPF